MKNAVPHLAVFKDKLASVTATHAQLVQLLCRSEAWSTLLHNECSDAMGPLVRRSLRLDSMR
jgi:hypothetical protein